MMNFVFIVYLNGMVYFAIGGKSSGGIIWQWMNPIG